MPCKMASAEDYDKLAQELELQELEAPGGVSTSQVYEKLLAVYILQNDLNNAKYLWKRIPLNLKTTHPELSLVWGIGQKMWQRDFAGIYESLTKEWSDDMKPVISAITESTRQRALTLVSQAYTSISVEDFSKCIGLPQSEAIQAAVQHGWEVDTRTKIVTPKRPMPPQQHSVASEQQLSRLTEFVTFLEN